MVVLIIQLVAVVGVAVAVAVAGVPILVAVLVAAGVGVGLVAPHMARRRFSGAERRAPETVAEFSTSLPAERVAVGRLLQPRFLPRTRAVWAPGVLGVGPGVVTFVPSSDRHADRAWRGRVDRAEVVAMHARASTVRVSGPQGDAQFVTQVSAAEASAALGPFVTVG